MLLKPVDELLKFARLIAFLALQHGDRKIADFLGLGVAGFFGRPIEHALGSNKPMKPPWRLTIERGFLPQIDIHAVEKNRHPV